MNWDSNAFERFFNITYASTAALMITFFRVKADAKIDSSVLVSTCQNTDEAHVPCSLDDGKRECDTV